MSAAHTQHWKALLNLWAKAGSLSSSSPWDCLSLSIWNIQSWWLAAETPISHPRNSQELDYVFRVRRHFCVCWIDHFVVWVAKEEVKANLNRWENWLPSEWIHVPKAIDRQVSFIYQTIPETGLWGIKNYSQYIITKKYWASLWHFHMCI